MRAAGCELHKALRLMRGTPLIERSILALSGRGLSQVFVSLSRSEPALVHWVSTNRERLQHELGSELRLIVEDAPLGTIGAIALLPPTVEVVLVVNVDNVTTLDLTDLMRVHRWSGAAATIACHEHRVRLPYGRLDLSGERVTRYAEKPVVHVPVSSGTYVLSRDAIDMVMPGAAMDVPVLIAMLLARGAMVSAYRHDAEWLDINDEATLREAEARG